MLKDSYDQVKADSGKLVYADHLNIATAFIQLKEPKIAYQSMVLTSSSGYKGEQLRLEVRHYAGCFLPCDDD
jgi:hypothetical protein